jgi:hypothetical protein
VYGQHLYVGGEPGERFDAALDDALRQLDVRAVERVRVAAPAIEEPSLSLWSPVPGGPVMIHVRGVRSPRWNLALVRRLSCALGGWGAAVVNDRARDEYGYLYAYAGHVIEAAAIGYQISDLAIGFAPGTPRRVIVDRCDEHKDVTRLWAASEVIAAEHARWALGQDGPGEVLGLVAADGSSASTVGDRVEEDVHARWFELRPEPLVRAVVTGIDPDGAAALGSALAGRGWAVTPHRRELFLDDEPWIEELAVLSVRGAGDADVDELIARIDAAGATMAAIARLGAGSGLADLWSRADRGAWAAARVSGLDDYLRAWAAVRTRTGAPLVAWDGA